jgi:hypothetical protein
MPRVVIDLPYVPESAQIAEVIKQQVTQTLPGATVQVVDTAPPTGADARGLDAASSPQPPLTQQPRRPTPQMGPPSPQGAPRRPMPSPGPMGPTQRRLGPPRPALA